MGMDDAKRRAEQTFNSAAEFFDDPALGFWDRFGRATVERLGLRRGAPDYAFPHSGEDESCRLELLEQRLDPLTKRRIGSLGVGEGARCLEIGGGRGSITRWLSAVVGLTGRVIATDLELGFLSAIDAANVEVLRHDIRADAFPP